MLLVIRRMTTAQISRGYANGRYLQLSGGTISGELLFNGGDDTDNLSIYPNKGNDDFCNNCAEQQHTAFSYISVRRHGDASKRTHLTIGNSDTGQPVTNIYHLSEPVQDDQPATKGYVDANAVGVVSQSAQS